MMLARSLFLFALWGYAGLSGARQFEPTLYTGSSGSTLIGRDLYVLEDVAQFHSPELALSMSNWVRSTVEVPNLGVSNAAKWLRFDLNNTSFHDRLVVEIQYPELDKVTAYQVNGQLISLLANIGQSESRKTRIGPYDEMAFAVDVPTGSSTTILLRISSTKQLQVPIKITTPQEFVQSRIVRNLYIGGYFGIMLVLALYNLFLYISVKDRSYLYYVLYIACLCVAQLTLQGVGQAYFWIDLPWFGSKASVVLTLMSMLFAGAFIRNFMNTPSITPRLDGGLVILMSVIGATALMDIFGSSILAYKLAQALSGGYSIYIITLAVVAIRSGSREAKFFLIAWGAFLVGVVVYILKDVGVLPHSPMTQYAMPIGSAIEGILLSFGLADRINILRKEKELSQAAALHSSLENERIIREQNVMLEDKVEERTRELNKSNEHLKFTQTQLVNSEKMASLGQLTAGIAHEINNPINFITSNILPLKRNIADIVTVMKAYREVPANGTLEHLSAVREREKQMDLEESINELDDIIGSIAEGSSRTAEIVRGLRNFSRLDEDDLKDADLNEGIRNTVALLAPQHKDRIRIDMELERIPSVECFPGKINQVFMNILTNGVQAAVARTDGKDPHIRILTETFDDKVQISIRDNGMGMTEEVQARMFDPFFTTKPVGEGTGLGLAIVYGIIEDHHGSIIADSVVGEGTEFRILLPIRHARMLQQRA